MTIFVLLILFQIKHFIADYPLQTPYMLGKFKDKGWVLPLLAHVGVHAGFTFLIVVPFVGVFAALALAALDAVIHFVMDRVKASPKMLGRYQALTKSEFPTATLEQKESNTKFWWALGLDQGVHHLTHYLIIFLVVVMQ